MEDDLTACSNELVKLLSPAKHDVDAVSPPSFVEMAFREFGSEPPTTREEELRRLNLLYLKLTPAEDIAMEDRAYEVAWFDYRYLHPVEAVQVLVNSWTVAFQRGWATNMDSREALKKVGFSINGGEATVRKNWVMFLHLRQRADELGFPYRVSLNEAIKMKFDLGVTRFLPSQVLLERHIAEREKAELRMAGLSGSERTPVLHIFWDRFFRGDAAQRSVKGWALRYIEYETYDRELYSAIFLRRSPILNEGEITGRFGPEMLEQAKACRRVTGVDDCGLSDEVTRALLPSCFGIPAAADTTRGVCSGCPHFGLCEKAAVEIADEGMRTFGVPLPALERKKKQARLRQRRRRARLRGVAITSAPPEEPQLRTPTAEGYRELFNARRAARK